MSEAPADVVIPDRPTFKPSEVCDLLKLQPYVLRSWENEFKDLGVAKTPGAPRVYRRTDVEMAVRIRQLVFGEGLTLAGVRRRFEQERPPAQDGADVEVPVLESATVTPETRVRIERAKQGLRGVLDLLGATPPRTTTEGQPRAERQPTPTNAGHESVLFDLAPPSPPEPVVETVSVDAADTRRPSRRKKSER